ncbi:MULTISPECIES: IS110-like element IS117 family transposase [Streptomyces]|uniref:Mini-circle putative transposase for IS117 n=2 Tax=Streptomyces TaxID=1883 RepID=YM3_STRCO|nr:MULTISPECIES: IS110-like element IS117 family transposase [Streptomyces]P14707.1 RecName: Full=Mini-circle putative transposase for IS117 [Streptomyces coelicolor A3(2)]WOZ01531.1 IS110-like element IS117 family transposase [Streptomyces violaceoruber]MDX2930806.1 IS110-like element IS117 family transposase [Streptomyces sp. NRRL_B-16638]MDX3409231.1 IS110-like element IS117 family transposase [Streptomyces sp. ME02-6977A]MYU41126.1 IS110-like element IS117 family transposase [Streptomyces 
MWEDSLTVFCGIDWAERHHDVAIVDDTGTLLAKARITDDVAGYNKLLDLLAEHGDSSATPIPVAIETSHGLLVAALRTGSRKVFAINPLAAARYRDRHGVSRKKSDPGDALVLANILRTDMHAHRPLPADSELAQAITVLARAQQDAVWNRQQVANQVRSLLREYYPAALHAFQSKDGGLTRPDARVILTMAPTPAKAAKLTLAQLRAGLKRSGRTRAFNTEIERLRGIFRSEYARQLPAVEDAFGHQLLALLRQLDATCLAADDLAKAVEDAFREHADSEILLSFPGLGPLLGARVLAEIGDDRSRFTDARALKSYAGSAPITRASGRKHFVGRRFVKNNRLMNAGFLWAFAALQASPGANAHYRRRREHGDWHAAAQRHLLNRFLGQLHHCLQTRQHFDEQRAFAPLLQAAA